MAPSTFASAAASNNSTPSRTDSGDGALPIEALVLSVAIHGAFEPLRGLISSEGRIVTRIPPGGNCTLPHQKRIWMAYTNLSRSRRTNGATQTFRRSSLAASSTNPNTRDSSTPSSNIYVPPHIASSRNGIPAEARYSKDQLLDLLKQQHEAVHQAQDLSALFVSGWDGRDTNGASYGESDLRERGVNGLPHGADICWEPNGGIQPLGLTEMTEEEKEPPTQNATKDGSARDGLSLRKSSITRDPNNPAAFGLASPTATRSGTRRREPSESYPFPTSVPSPSTGSKFFREDSNPAQPPPSLLRRRTDFKEGVPTPDTEEKEKDKPQEEGSGQSGPTGTLKRTATGSLSAGLNAPSSPWSSTPQSAGFNPVGGAFGSFAIGGSQATSTGENRSSFGSARGQSRFKGLMSKDNSEEANRNIREKQSAGELGKIDEGGQTHQAQAWMDPRRDRTFTMDTDDGARAGSAALGGAQDISPPRTQVGAASGTPSRGDSRDDYGFSAFGMTPDHLPGGLRDILQNRDQLQQLAQQQQQSGAGTFEPMSPTDTNPFQSPETHPQDVDVDESDLQATHLPGLGSHATEQGNLPGLSALGGLGGFGRTHIGPESDRSQTSSAGPNRQFPNLTGLGGLPGLGNSTWGSSAPVGTPLRERTSTNAFADSFLGSSAEVQSPSLAGLGPSNIFGSGAGMGFGGATNVSRGSRLGSLLPTAMQDEMRPREDIGPLEENIGNESRDRNLGSFGNAAQHRFDTGLGRDSDSPFHAARGAFDEILGSASGEAVAKPHGQPQPQAGIPGTSSVMGASTSFNQGPQQRPPQQPEIRQSQGPASSASSQPPPAQQRTMVMPDRMRWIYRDPQGNTQGPWSGLEMHDWYKAGFFSPELLVKKYEDPDYEPLAQLIRRIGNSREPFLVPQIGIPHGPPNGGPSAWSGQNTSSNQPTATGQPPFASAFPSFGTTLTAEQQNALERRKQEEQYLMARQKEHLQAQHQYQRQMQMSGQLGSIPQQLQHHSSAHSLQSQPSFGSITSPSGYQQSPSQTQIQTAQSGPGFFDNSFRPTPSTFAGPSASEQETINRMKEQELSTLLGRLNPSQASQPPFTGQPGQFDSQQDPAHSQQVAQMLNDRSRLQREQAEYDSQPRFNQQEEQSAAARLQQFHGLRAGQMQEPTVLTEGVIGQPQSQQSDALQLEQQQQELNEEQTQMATAHGHLPSPRTLALTDTLPAEALSLTEQVQKATSAQQSPAPQSPWGKVETGMPQPFPPPPSQSPLPAPAAQRSRHNVAEALSAESRSRSETPVETPTSIAPWAKESTEAPKGPSLKEIQELEAKKAAQRDAEEAAVRRAAFEKDLMAQHMAPQPAPGLPQSSTWGSGQSPVTPGSAAASAWAKPLAGKPTGSGGAGPGKTLAQIQKEEEARKKLAAAAKASSAAATGSGTAPPLSSGKRYADLASKTAAPQPSVGGGAWTTVGANGKTKATGLPTAPAANRAASSAATALSAAAPRPKPTTTPSRSATMGGAVSQANAQEEFKKWAITELRPDLKGNISVDDFVATLMALPFDSDMITEAVHSSSQTIDSRHFADEFIRRRKLADRGMVDPSGTLSPASAAENKSGGWSEVAKKGPATKEEPNNFKVVAAKKKGTKR
ncbi:MAG: hypothetical protein Q9165_002481 [Trypethelium subeluteriae]